MKIKKYAVVSRHIGNGTSSDWILEGFHDLEKSADAQADSMNNKIVYQVRTVQAVKIRTENINKYL